MAEGADIIGGNIGEGDGGSAKHITAHSTPPLYNMNCLSPVLSSAVTRGGLTTRLGLWGGSELYKQEILH